MKNYKQLAFTGTMGSGGGGGGGSDIKVKVSANDTTTDYLSSKLISSDNSASLVITSPSGNEKLNLSVTNYQTITYDNLVIAMGAGTLVPNRMYKITGFNKNMPSGSPSNPNGWLPVVLYDDGTDSGITIYMVAQTPTMMADSGFGEFYNPKYYDGNSYYNVDGTGLYGIWDGDNPDPLQVPAYSVGQVVFWGGYAWQNTSGNVGFANNVLTLNSADWDKLPYSNNTWYNQVIDEIKVDWTNGILVERTNAANQITVAFNAPEYSWWMGIYNSIQCNPISGMGWGIYSKVTQGVDGDYYGITNVESINSLCETINFKGIGFFNIYFEDSYMYLNYFGMDVYFIFYSSNNYGTFSNNTITSGSYLEGNINNGGIIGANSFINNCTISYSILNGGSIQNNQFDYVRFRYNTINVGGQILNNIASSDSEISNNILNDRSYISVNNLTSGYITYNILETNSNISNNNVTTNSTINSNYLNNNSQLSFNTFSNGFFVICNNLYLSSISNNTCNGGSLNRNILISSSFTVNSINESNVTDNYCNKSDIIGNSMALSSELVKNYLTSNSNINSNTLPSNGQINNNYLESSSYISGNYVDNSTIELNELQTSFISSNAFSGATIDTNSLKKTSNISNGSLDSSSISKNIFDANSSLQILLSGSSFTQNALYGSQWNLTLATITAKTIHFCTSNWSGYFPADLSTATNIFNGASKTVFIRNDGLVRLLWYANSDTPTVANFTS